MRLLIGCVRDVEILETIEIGILALGSVPKRSEKMGRGSIGEALNLNGVSVKSGDWIYCDRNGAIISKQEIKLKK